MLPKKILAILDQYKTESPGVKDKLVRLLMHGQTRGTGKVVISAVDQGFEHGPLQSFGKNFPAHDPLYHFDFAAEAKLSALAAPMGFLEIGADQYAGQLPLILKLNSSNILAKPAAPDQALTSSVDDALRLGCVGVGFTIYPGSNLSFNMFEELRDVIKEARAKGLLVIVWSYPRSNLSPAGETGLDVVAYGAHMACLLGAHIVKIKMPSSHIETEKSKGIVASENLAFEKQEDCVKYIMESTFQGKRMAIFSGGASKDTADLLAETKAIQMGGGYGSIIGRNIFQRPRAEALKLANDICAIYCNEGA